MLNRSTLPIIIGTDVPTGRRYDAIDLPRTWRVGMNPTITYNNETRTDDKWNVPGSGIAETIRCGNMLIKFQCCMEKIMVREQDFGKDWNSIQVIPGLVQKPFFLEES